MEKLFYGRYEHNIDKKSRLVLPSKYRKILNEIDSGYNPPGLYMKIEKGHISCCPQSVHEKKVAKELKKTEGNFNRKKFFLENKFEKIDNQGRIILPEKFRNGLESVVITANGNLFDIWNPAKYESQFGVLT